jgi:hypothetical protein
MCWPGALLATPYVVRVKVAVTEATPLPLAVLLIVRLLTSAALLGLNRVVKYRPEFLLFSPGAEARGTQ